MALELDHLFVMCDGGAPEAEALVRLGLTDGPPNTHPGQGTACRRFFFESQYLECVWLTDAERGRDPQVERLGLHTRWEHWHHTKSACPFGVLLRRTKGETAMPFPSWRYEPSYLPSGSGIDVATDMPITEPFVAVMNAQHRPTARPPGVTRHRLPLRSITSVTIDMPHTPRSTAADWLARHGLVTFGTSHEHLLCLTFDDGVLSETADLRPTLPIVLRWS